MEKAKVLVSTWVDASIERAWECWTDPRYITRWNFASPDWHCPRAANDLRVGGAFSARMEARDGSFGFDFAGTYTAVVPRERLEYKLGEERSVRVTFASDGVGVRVDEEFDAEEENPIEMQRSGWQSILDNYKACVESRIEA